MTWMPGATFLTNDFLIFLVSLSVKVGCSASPASEMSIRFLDSLRCLVPPSETVTISRERSTFLFVNFDD